MSSLPLSEPDELIHDIQQALEARPKADGVHVSIEPAGREMADPEGKLAYVKAVCWNLTRSGKEFPDDEPNLLLLHEDHNDESLGEALRPRFPGRKIVVDNEIWIDDDPQ